MGKNGREKRKWVRMSIGEKGPRIKGQGLMVVKKRKGLRVRMGKEGREKRKWVRWEKRDKHEEWVKSGGKG